MACNTKINKMQEIIEKSRKFANASGKRKREEKIQNQLRDKNRIKKIRITISDKDQSNPTAISSLFDSVFGKSNKKLIQTPVVTKTHHCKMKELIDLLNNESTEVVFKSLCKLQKTFSENVSEKVKQFLQVGGLDKLLLILGRPNVKLIKTALNVLGHCSVEKESQKIIANSKTISKLMTLFTSLDDNNIHKIILKIVANLARNQEAVIVIHKEGVIENIIDFLLLIKCDINRQIAIDALNKSSKSAKHRLNIVTALVKKYNADDENIFTTVLTILSKLTIVYTKKCVEQIVTKIGLSNLLIYAQSCDNENLKQTSSIILSSIIDSDCSEIRFELAVLGVIPIFIQQIRDFLATGNVEKRRFLNSLKQFVLDYTTFDRVCNNDELLETFILLLNRSDLKAIHNDVILTLNGLCSATCNKKGLEKLLKLNLVGILVDKVAIYLSEIKNEHKPHELKTTNLKYLNYINDTMKILSNIVVASENYHLLFMTETILDTLLLVIASAAHRKIVTGSMTILKRLISSSVCLKLLISMNFSHKVSKMLNDSVCGDIKDIRDLILTTFQLETESSFGIDIVSKILSRGSQSERESAAVVLPYLRKPLCQQSRTRKINSVGLELIFQTVANPSYDKFTMFLAHLVEIYSQVHKCDNIQKLLNQQIQSEYCFLNNESILNRDVTFVLDDEQRISANRVKLAESSEIFNIMLYGSFKEARQTEIRFGEVSVECFEHIVHLLHGCTYSCLFLKSSDYEILFGASILADRLLLMEMKSDILARVVETMTVKNAAIIYEFAHVNEFACSSILPLVMNRVLSPLYTQDDKIYFFQQLLNSNVKDSILLQIKNEINQYLHVSASINNN